MPSLYSEGKSNGKAGGGSVVPTSHPEDKVSKGFSEKGIRSQQGGSPGDELAQDQMGKGAPDGPTGPTEERN